MKRVIKICLVFITISLFCQYINAQVPNNRPPIINYVDLPVGVNPEIDGECTFNPEWDSANVHINIDTGRRGAICREYQIDWDAVSSSGNNTVYGGITLFELHDFWEAKDYDSCDFNKFGWGVDSSINNPNTSLVAWVFDDMLDKFDDRAWLNGERALSNPGQDLWGSVLRNDANAPNYFDDIGFIVRLNNDPLTDRQWKPGDPEPGDPNWNWEDYYGFFGKFGFNESTRDLGVPWTVNYVSVMGATSVQNEVYEFALHGGIGGGVPDSMAYQPCIHTFRTIHHFDPHSGDNEYILITVIDGPGHISQPENPRPGGGKGGPGSGKAIIPVVPGEIKSSYIEVANIGLVDGVFKLTITDDLNWIEDTEIEHPINAISQDIIRYDFQVPDVAAVGDINTFYFSCYATLNPDYIDVFKQKFMVIEPTNHLIWEPSSVISNSAESIREVLNAHSRIIEFTDDITNIEDLNVFNTLWICLGMSPSNYSLIPGSYEVELLSNYLLEGGNIYLEGGNTWATDPPTDLHSYFHIDGYETGPLDLNNVIGYDEVFGFDFQYTPDYNVLSIDRIKPYWEDEVANLLFINRDAGYGLGLSYRDLEQENGYKTIGTSFEFGSLTNESLSWFTRYDLMDVYLTFFEGDSLITSIEDEYIKHMDSMEVQVFPNPFQNEINIRYNLSTPSDIIIDIYNISGQVIQKIQLKDQKKDRGLYNLKTNSFPIGIYFLQVRAGQEVTTQKVVKMN